MAVASEVGNGENTLFYQWIHDKSIEELVPRLFAAVPRRRANGRTVREALTDNNWLSYIMGALHVGVLIEYLQVRDIMEDIALQPEIEDTHSWKLCSSGKYSAHSVYESLFRAATQFGPWERIWKTWAHQSVGFLCG